MKKLLLSFVLLFTLTGCNSNSTENYDVDPVDYATDTAVERDEITEQDKVIETQTNKYNKGDYTAEDPFVVVDPFSRNVLSAYVAFPVENASTYSFTVEGKDEYTSFTSSSEVEQTGTMIVPVYGLYADYNNTVTIDVLEGGEVVNTVTTKIKTKAVNEDFAIYESIDMDTSYSSVEEAAATLENGFLFTSKDNGYDINGEIRVALGDFSIAYENGVQYNADGSLLMTSLAQNAIYDVDMNGYINAIYVGPEDKVFHHDAFVASNGYVYALTDYDVDFETSQAEDKLNMGTIAVYEQGTVSTPVYEKDLSLDFIGSLVNNGTTSGGQYTDLLHLNSVTYDEPTDTIIVSSQSTNMIIGLDAHNLDVKWTNAEEENRITLGEYALEQLDGYEAPNGQHNVHVTNDPKYDDGKDYTIEVQVFDNLFCVDEEGNSVYAELLEVPAEKDCGGEPTSKILVQRINTRKGTIETIESQEIEDYRSHTQSGWYTSLSNEYNFITYTNAALVVVTDADYNIIFEASISKDINPYNISLYRTRALASDELNEISDRGLTNLIGA